MAEDFGTAKWEESGGRYHVSVYGHKVFSTPYYGVASCLAADIASVIRQHQPTPKETSDQHFADQEMTKEDVELGDKLAQVIGDLFINSMEVSPSRQWTKVASALRFHGLKIVDGPKANKS